MRIALVLVFILLVGAVGCSVPPPEPSSDATASELIAAQAKVVDLMEQLESTGAQLRVCETERERYDIERGCRDKLEATEADRDRCYGQLGQLAAAQG